MFLWKDFRVLLLYYDQDDALMIHETATRTFKKFVMTEQHLTKNNFY